MRGKIIGAAALLLALLGCAGTGVNTANVFQSQSGTIQLKVDTPDTSISSVEFTVNDQKVGEDTNGSDGWSVDYDTTKLADGIYTVRANGTSPTGTVELLNNSLLIKNGNAAGTGASAEPSATAAPSAMPSMDMSASPAPTDNAATSFKSAAKGWTK
jgi:hypothetical protein